MPLNDGRILIEGAEILYRNFTGVEGEYNPPGSRNFCVVLPPDLEEQLKADGWNVRYEKVREDGSGGRPYLPVQIGYKIRPPRVQMISYKSTPRGRIKMRTEVPEKLLGLLDWVDIANADVSVNPSRWNKNGRTGIKAYLKALYLTVADDYLEQKYADVEEYVIDGEEARLELTMTPHEDEFLDLESEYVDEPRQIGR